MRLRHVAAGLIGLVLCVGCRGNRNPFERLSATASTAPPTATSVASAITTAFQTTVTGKVHSAGGELGTWDIVLDKCQSGEVNGFYGADFYAVGSDELRLRYVHDEAVGDVVKVAIPSQPGKLIVFDRKSECTVLEGSIAKTNVTSWTPKGKIRHLDGHVKFDCKHSDGKGRVTGEVTFAQCH